jgi:hypothetical protein
VNGGRVEFRNDYREKWVENLLLSKDYANYCATANWKTTIWLSPLKCSPRRAHLLKPNPSSSRPFLQAVPVLAILEDPGKCEAVVLDTMDTLPPS